MAPQWATKALRAASGTGRVDSPAEMIDYMMTMRPLEEPDGAADYELGSGMSAAEAAAYALAHADDDVDNATVNTEGSAG